MKENQKIAVRSRLGGPCAIAIARTENSQAMLAATKAAVDHLIKFEWPTVSFYLFEFTERVRTLELQCPDVQRRLIGLSDITSALIHKVIR
ncbi:hypothetical protein AB4Z52_23635 [Rhizobium sp. 2YAF20]|uniref:hypothetical protein n=1 Tax=Rhizobium sp. 2YAF20 TaxID=3233027 RepID=UPI003F9480A2